jgi:hypothetical protein
MTDWSLSGLLDDLHKEIEGELRRIRKSIGHPTALGDASETVWIELLKSHLPERYAVEKAFIVDSKGKFSQQIDLVIFDRRYTPFVLNYKGQKVIPIESVYAVFEAKQTINAAMIGYAKKKALSVRKLYRTSAPIYSMGKKLKARKLFPILAGVLAFESDWNPPFGAAFKKALTAKKPAENMDLGCIAAHGCFWKMQSGYKIDTEAKAVTHSYCNIGGRRDSHYREHDWL